jgi:hypothetical protein
MNFFRISDPEGMFFCEIFLNYLKNPCSFIFLPIRLAPETIRSNRKVEFIFYIVVDSDTCYLDLVCLLKYNLLYLDPTGYR